MKKALPVGILAFLISLTALAAAGPDYPPISIIPPSSGNSTIDKTQFLILVVEPGFISCDGVRVPPAGLIGYINGALKAKGASFLGVHIRQGIRFGDVVKVLDELRKTDAKSIGVSMVELSPGKEP